MKSQESWNLTLFASFSSNVDNESYHIFLKFHLLAVNISALDFIERVEVVRQFLVFALVNAHL